LINVEDKLHCSSTQLMAHLQVRLVFEINLIDMVVSCEEQAGRLVDDGIDDRGMTIVAPSTNFDLVIAIAC
jgi:hypothetical protein